MISSINNLCVLVNSISMIINKNKLLELKLSIEKKVTEIL